MKDLTIAIVRAEDVLVLTTPELLPNAKRSSYLTWFCESLKGTSLERCKVILLDGGADVQVYRGEPQNEPMQE